MTRKISQQDLEKELGSYLASVGGPDPASLGAVLERLPGRASTNRRAHAVRGGLVRGAALAVVLVVAVAAVGLPFVLARPAAAGPSPSARLAPAPAASPGPPGAFRSTGSMSTNRWWGQTSTLLPDGRVLVAGGCSDGINACNQSSTAELYDPKTGHFTTTGSMTEWRSEHTATLLHDGQILIAGGHYAGTATLAWAELYDPATGKFTQIGSLSYPRYGHTATLLQDGRVLIAGGEGDSGFIAQAEIYDPGTGKFTVTGFLAIARADHTATLLPDGRVLIAGGLGDVGAGMAGALASAELYDPRSGTFSPTGTMTTVRDQLTATLLSDGRVLVAGGHLWDGTRRPPTTTALASAELYDPSTGTFSPTGSMGTARGWGATSTLLLDGRVLLAGGFSVGIGPINSTELYDPASRTFSPAGSMTTDRYTATATLLPDGRVLVAGGCDGNALLASAELYEPAGMSAASESDSTESAVSSQTVAIASPIPTLTPTPSPIPTPPAAPTSSIVPGPGFSATGSMSFTDGALAASLSDGRVLVVAGGDPTANVYNPRTGTFSPTGDMTVSRFGETATRLQDGRVLITGGYDGHAFILASAELYDPETGAFTSTGSMSTPREFQTATLLPDGRVLVAGGSMSKADLASAELYDPATGKFSPTGSMHTSRDGHTATLLKDGRVLIVGGGGEATSPGSSAELYDPKTGTFSPTGSTINGRWLHTATLLADGRVLITGGKRPDDYQYATAELYNPGTGKFSPTGSMNTARQEHTATLLPDGRVLIAGGSERTGQMTWDTLASTELYDPATGTFSPSGSMTVTRSDHTATLLTDGRVLIAGGSYLGDSGGVGLASAELYQP